MSDEGPWQPPRSARWVPAPAERAAFEQFAQTIEGLFPTVDHYGSDDPPLPPRAARTVFFQHEDPRNPGLPTRFAVVGGSSLVIAYRAADGRWVVGDFTPATRFQPRMAQQPLGVFDIDGDGFPEVLVHFNYGDSYGDTILRSTDHGRSWDEAATGVGGSTA